VGAVLAVPVEAEPWSVEVRSESSYLFAGYESAGFPAVRRSAGEVALTLDRGLVPGLVVACDVLLAHPYLKGHRHPVGWLAMGSGRGLVSVVGPGLVYFTEPESSVSGLARTIGVKHVWLAGLRRALEPWAGSPPPVVRPLG
jgi:hypothetical protein